MAFLASLAGPLIQGLVGSLFHPSSRRGMGFVGSGGAASTGTAAPLMKQGIKHLEQSVPKQGTDGNPMMQRMATDIVSDAHPVGGQGQESFHVNTRWDNVLNQSVTQEIKPQGTNNPKSGGAVTFDLHFDTDTVINLASLRIKLVTEFSDSLADSSIKYADNDNLIKMVPVNDADPTKPLSPADEIDKYLTTFTQIFASLVVSWQDKDIFIFQKQHLAQFLFHTLNSNNFFTTDVTLTNALVNQGYGRHMSYPHGWWRPYREGNSSQHAFFFSLAPFFFAPREFFAGKGKLTLKFELRNPLRLDFMKSRFLSFISIATPSVGNHVMHPKGTLQSIISADDTKMKSLTLYYDKYVVDVSVPMQLSAIHEIDLASKQFIAKTYNTNTYAIQVQSQLPDVHFTDAQTHSLAEYKDYNCDVHVIHMNTGDAGVGKVIEVTPIQSGIHANQFAISTDWTFLINGRLYVQMNVPNFTITNVIINNLDVHFQDGPPSDPTPVNLRGNDSWAIGSELQDKQTFTSNQYDLMMLSKRSISDRARSPCPKGDLYLATAGTLLTLDTGITKDDSADIGAYGVNLVSGEERTLWNTRIRTLRLQENYPLTLTTNQTQDRGMVTNPTEGQLVIRMQFHDFVFDPSYHPSAAYLADGNKTFALQKVVVRITPLFTAKYSLNQNNTLPMIVEQHLIPKTGNLGL